MLGSLGVGALGLFGLGCGVGSSHPSQVNDVQVLAAVVEPAQPAPGDTVLAQVYVADPLERGTELLVWSCTPADDLPCAELVGGVEALAAVVDEPVEGRFSLVRTIPEEAASLAVQAGFGAEGLALVVFLLACEPGLCPVISEARAALAAPQDTEAARALAAQLADPESWMRDLPLEGVALATRLVPLAGGGSRNENPSAEQRFRPSGDVGTPLRVQPGEAVNLRFSVYDPDGTRVDAFGYTTLGRFDEERVREDRENDAVLHWLLAPEEPGTGTVWVVFDDRDGGRAVWTVPLVVQ